MERIFSTDVEQFEPKVRWRGYDRAEVSDMLLRVTRELETLRTELAQASATLEQQKSELAGYRAQENTLQQALILAQKTADDTRANAHREAELIQEDARQKVADIQRDMEARLNDLRWEIERLRLDKQKFVNSFRAMLESHLRDLAEQGGLSVIDGDAVEDAAQGS